MIAICPTQEKLKSLSLGQLPEEQSDELIRHLESCDMCQEEISQIDDVDDTLIQQLKSAETDVADDFESENGCRVAVTRALAALASVGDSTRISQNMADRDLPKVPKTIGEYDIVSSLGQGGMGHVYLGKHTKLNRPVAIKFLADHRRWDKSMHDRFESEMRLIGGLNHPNIVVAHDAREVDGLAVLVTEYIEGMTVSEILRRTGTFSVADSAKVVSEICKALQYIDSQGLVHRDIKPSNIMIDVDGTVKLLDLGLARLQASEEEMTEFTATGQAMGTADYVAPEQVNDGRNVDIRADVYGLGCTLYKMLSGHAPFAKTHHTSFAKMNAHVSEVPATLDSVRGVSGELVKLVSQMLEKDPVNRPQSPQEVLDRISKAAKSADLAALVVNAKNLPDKKIVAPVPLEAKPQTETSFYGKYPWVAAVAGGLAAMAFGIWLGIIISVKKPDGTITKVEIPDGSTAIVDSEGNIEILLPGSERTLRIPSANVEISPEVTKTQPKQPLDDLLSAESSLVSRPTRLVVPKHSAIYGKIENYDQIDIIEVQDNTNGELPVRNLLVSNQKVKVEHTAPERFAQVAPGQPAQGKTELIVSKDVVKKVAKSLSEGKRIELEFHDSLRQQNVDEVNINGIWRVVLLKRNGSVNGSKNQKVVVFHRHQMVILDSNHEYSIHPFQLRIENSESHVLLIGDASKSLQKGHVFGFGNADFQKAYYKFLESGRLDLTYSIASKDMGAGGGMQKMAASGSWRLERVTEPQTEFEKSAFEIIAAANQAKTKVEFFIAKEDNSNQETRPDWIKAPYTDPSSGKHFRLIGKPVLSNEDILSARPQQQDGRHDIQITLTAAGEAKAKFHTGRNIGMYMAILVNDKLISAPKINSTIGRNCLITGNFTANEAKTIAAAIVPEMKIASNLNGTQSKLESRMRSLNNLRQLALGLHNFANANKSFPASANSKNGQPPHSWRVAILPYIGHQELFAKYNFDEPWDSEANRALLTEMPSLYRHPLMPATSDFTNYIGAAGKEYAFGAETGKDFAQFLDGTSNSILLIEADTKIPWTKPDDLDFEKQWKSFKSFDSDAIPVAFADGSTAALDKSKLNATQWKSMFQISDGNINDRTLFEVDEPVMDVFR